MHAQGLSGANAPGEAGGDSSAVYLSPSRRWLVSLAVLMVCPWIVAGWLLSPWSPLEPATASASSATSVGPLRQVTQPWGSLEYTEITISPPMEFLNASLVEEKPVIVEEPVEASANSDLDMDDDLLVETNTDLLVSGHTWNFPETGRESIETLLKQAGLTTEQHEQLLATITRLPDNRGYKLMASDALVRSLSQHSRRLLYSRLAQSDLNERQRGAFRFRGESVEQWLAKAKLSANTVELVKSYSYQQGPFLFFADLELVIPEIDDKQERLRLVKALSRERTMLAKLRVDRNSDIEALVNYWGRGGRAKDVRPILESISQLPGGGSIDITHLLPPLARRRVYTFPTQAFDPMSVKRNSHWTALNFFKDNPDDRYVEPQEVANALDEDYYRIFGNLAFGDLIMFVQNQRQAFHTAVYLADDVVYTKSGNQSTGPWILMNLSDVKHYYAKQGQVNLIYFRRRDL